MEFHLCQECEKKMLENGLYGLTVEEMFEQQVQFDFGVAIMLFKEGHELIRASKMDDEYKELGGYSYKLVVDENSKEKQYRFAMIYEGKIISYLEFAVEDILAEDWMIKKLADK